MIVDELDKSHDLCYFPYHHSTGHTLRDCLALKEQPKCHSYTTTMTLYESFTTKDPFVVVGISFRRISSPSIDNQNKETLSTLQ